MVVGASLAGMSAVQALRAADHDGPIVVFEAPQTLPKDRPPLSKQVLAGEWERGSCQPAGGWSSGELDLDLRLGSRSGVPRCRRPHRRARTTASSSAPTGIVVATRIVGPIAARATARGSAHAAHRATTPWRCGTPRGLDRTASWWWAQGSSVPRWRPPAAGAAVEVTMVEAAAVPLQRALPGEIGVLRGRSAP